MDRKLERDEWQAYFDFFSRELMGQRALIEVAGLDLGDQVEGQWVFLEGLTYDEGTDTFYVHTLPLDHQIKSPQEIYVLESGVAISVIGIKDAAGRMQVIRLREPLRLAGRTATSRPVEVDDLRI